MKLQHADKALHLVCSILEIPQFSLDRSLTVESVRMLVRIDSGGG